MSGLVWVLVIKKHVDIPPHVSLFLPDVFGWLNMPQRYLERLMVVKKGGHSWCGK